MLVGHTIELVINLNEPTFPTLFIVQNLIILKVLHFASLLSWGQWCSRMIEGRGFELEKKKKMLLNNGGWSITLKNRNCNQKKKVENVERMKKDDINEQWWLRKEGGWAWEEKS